MKTFTQTSTFTVKNFKDVTTQQRELLLEAQKVRKNAQSPYSKFCVGVSVLTQTGNIYSGCNVERCSYSQTTHAEQNAIDTMVAQEGSVKIEKVAIVGGMVTEDPQFVDMVEEIVAYNYRSATFPCGHCLQIIWENCYADGEVEIISLTASGRILVTTMQVLYPVSFGPETLGISYE